MPEPKEKAFDKWDALYLAGAALVVAGAGLRWGLPWGLMFAGGFCLVFPSIQILAGLRRPRS